MTSMRWSRALAMLRAVIQPLLASPAAWLDLSDARTFALVLTLVGSAGLGLAAVLLVFTRKLWRGAGFVRAAAIPLAIGTGALAGGAGYALWYRFRPSPATIERDLAPGVHYVRRIISAPRPIVLHVAWIDLTTEGLRLITTPPREGRDLPARTTSAFAEEHGLQLAINAQFFHPFHANHPLDYYPEPGDLVHPISFAAAGGRVYIGTPRKKATLYVTPSGEVAIGLPDVPVQEAVSGRYLLVDDGRLGPGLDDVTVAPRTAVGLTEDRRTLLLMVVDGRQPGYSEGVTLSELGEAMLERGAFDAIELDGGGSSTMVTREDDGSVRVLNCPIHTRLACRQRPVANHLGIAVDAVGESRQRPGSGRS